MPNINLSFEQQEPLPDNYVVKHKPDLLNAEFTEIEYDQSGPPIVIQDVEKTIDYLGTLRTSCNNQEVPFRANAKFIVTTEFPTPRKIRFYTPFTQTVNDTPYAISGANKAAVTRNKLWYSAGSDVIQEFDILSDSPFTIAFVRDISTSDFIEQDNSNHTINGLCAIDGTTLLTAGASSSDAIHHKTIYSLDISGASVVGTPLFQLPAGGGQANAIFRNSINGKLIIVYPSSDNSKRIIVGQFTAEGELEFEIPYGDSNYIQYSSQVSGVVQYNNKIYAVTFGGEIFHLTQENGFTLFRNKVTTAFIMNIAQAPEDCTLDISTQNLL